MAKWYYSKNGQTFGPFTGEAMDDFISRGEVTFVTLVWSEETGRAGRGWVYAYETDLNIYFSDELTLPSLPPVDQSTAPEIPVILSKIPPADEPEDVPVSNEDTNAAQPKKTPRAIAAFLALFMAGLLVGTSVSGYIFRIRTPLENTVSVTEQALPSVDDGDSIVFKISDMEILRSFVFGIESAIYSLGHGTADESAAGGDLLSRVKPSMESLGGLFDAMDEMSVLVVPSDGPAVYASFIEKGGALDIFMSRPENFFRAETWETKPDDKMTGWKISLPFLENPVLYVLKRPYGKRNIVYAARTEEDVAAMLSASRGETNRFTSERATSGKDFLRIKFPNGLTRETIEKALAPVQRTRYVQTARSGRIPWTTGELSWTKEGHVLEYETYSDFLTQNPELAVNMPKITRDTKFLGDGELTCFIAVDAGFMMKCAFLGSADPVGEVFKDFDEIQTAFPKFAAAGDKLGAVLKNARLSAICTTKDRHAQTAYLLLETEAEESLDKFRQTYAPFAAALGGESIKLDGWTSAISARIPFYGGSNVNIVLAHKRGTLLFGIGEAANFSKNVRLKREYEDYISPENVANFIVSPKFYDALLGLMDRHYVWSASSADVHRKLKNGFTALGNSFQVFCGNVKPSGRANGKLVLTEGGDPAGAIFKSLSQIALAIPQYSRLNEKNHPKNDTTFNRADKRGRE